MDPDKAKRRQSLKIIISETIMFVSVVVTVVILAFLVSGYWINSDFKVERQGLLQVSSIPTGAEVNIDGDSSWFQRTNTSKVLSSGEHTVTLTKDGYDSWSKTINISEGLLYRIHYPRLFLQNTVAERVLDLETVTQASFSPDGSQLLLLNDSPSWQLIDLEKTDLEPTAVDIDDAFPGIVNSDSSEFVSPVILSLNWDKDNRHILLSAQRNDKTEWVLLDAHDIDKSINLTAEFGRDFSEVQILDHSANNLLAVIDGSLYKIDVSGRMISSALVKNVTAYNHYDTNEIIFSASDTSADAQSGYYVGILKPNNDEIVKIFDTSSPVHAVISKFYDDKYITILQDNLLSLYKYQDCEKIADYELTFTPDVIKVGHNGEFITAYSGDKIATLDMETETVTEWTTDSTSFGWIDNDMIYSINEAREIIVYDFDGLNRRTVASDASTSFPAKITDNKWLYFFDNNKLMRQVIAD